jgi:DNA-binding transcriptional ArsR family regulator
VIAHIGNIPVEEWLPFLVPLLALYVYGRRSGKRRGAAVRRLPGPTTPLDKRTLDLIRARWDAAGHAEVAQEQLPILYPPGPDGLTVSQLAARIDADRASVRRRLDDLADLGYVELDPGDGDDEPEAWLTAAGLDLTRLTEDVLLDEWRDVEQQGAK